MLSGGAAFSTRGFSAYGIPTVLLSDGPHGIRKQSAGANHLGIGGSEPATCFPTASTLADSWDPTLAERVGQALGEEAAAQRVGILLGPGLNMKRSPLCGRNFEYFSEDPYLAGKMAAGYIRGIQHNGITACPKHFAANNQEQRRMASNSVLDERTLREIYLTGFEIAVKEGHPHCMMSSYNQINGVYANENSHLLQDILRQEWDFRGAVISDWGGSHDHVEGVRCGSNLEMPFPGGDSIRKLVRAVRSGKISEQVVDVRLDELLEVLLPVSEAVRKHPGPVDMEGHHVLAREAAGESIVLLKNQKDFLPLQKGTKTCLIGDFAMTPRYQGAGSSLVNPTRLDTLTDCMENCGLDYVGYAQGFRRFGGSDRELEEAAVSLAKQSDAVLFCMGLDEIRESEGADRADIKIADNQIDVLNRIAAVNPNIAVLLFCGSCVEMPWIHCARAVVYGGLGGQAGAGAMIDVITGRINPSGKLAETFPCCLEDTPTAHRFPSAERNSAYREGLYIGYRYYDTAGKQVLFPFGFGLSYTTFEYRDLHVTREGVSFSLTNSGSRRGTEICQMYIHRTGGNTGANELFRPEQELKGFCRMELDPGETRRVSIPFDDKTFRYFDMGDSKWAQEGGLFLVRIGASSRDIRMSAEIRIPGKSAGCILPKTVLAKYQTASVQDITEDEFAQLTGSSVPKKKWSGISEDMTFGELNHCRSILGLGIWAVLSALKKWKKHRGKTDLNLLFIYNMPLWALSRMTAGMISEGMVHALVLELQGGWGIGIVWFLAEGVRNIVENIALEMRLSKKQK